MIDPKTRNAIVGGMRRIWHRHPTRIAALKAAEIREYLPLNADGSPPKRPRVFYVCGECGARTKSQANAEYTQAAVDHIDPVKPLDGSTPTLDEVAERMFTTPDNLRVLCDPCHSRKTLLENQLRREAKKLHAESTPSPRRNGKATA